MSEPITRKERERWRQDAEAWQIEFVTGPSARRIRRLLDAVDSADSLSLAGDAALPALAAKIGNFAAPGCCPDCDALLGLRDALAAYRAIVPPWNIGLAPASRRQRLTEGRGDE